MQIDESASRFAPAPLLKWLLIPAGIAIVALVLSELTVEVSPTADFANARKLEFAGA